MHSDPATRDCDSTSGQRQQAATVRILPFGLLAMLCLIWTGGMLLSSSTDMIATPDIEYYFRWVHTFAREQILAGRTPLWNPHIYAGIPFAANPQGSVFYPPSWLYLAMPVVHAHKWMIALHVLLAGAFMYGFLRHAGLRPSSALAGTLPWMFGGYTMANAAVGHLTMLFTMTWLPMVLLCYEQAIRSRNMRWLFWTGFVLGVQILAGEPQNGYYTIFVLIVYSLIRLRSAAREEQSGFAQHGLRTIASLGLIGFIAVLAAAVQIAPTFEFMLHSDRSANSYEFATQGSFPPSAFIGMIIPWSSELVGVMFIVRDTVHTVLLSWECAVYIGLMPLILAALSFRSRGHSLLTTARILAVFAVLLILGSHTPIYAILLKALPGLRLFRVPARAVLILTWSLCVLSAFGMEWLFQDDAGRWRRRFWRMTSATVLLITMALIAYSVDMFGVVKMLHDPNDWWQWVWEQADMSDGIVVRFLLAAAASLAVVLLLRWLPCRTATVAILAVVAFDLFLARPDIPLVSSHSRPDFNSIGIPAVPSATNATTSPCRVDLAFMQLAPNAAMGAGLENVNGYWPVALRRFYRFVHEMRGQSPPVTDRNKLPNTLYEGNSTFPLRVLNVRYATTIAPETHAISTLEDQHPLPRAWIADRAEVLTDENAILKRMADPNFDASDTVLLEKPPRIPFTPGTGPAGQCTAKKLADGSLEIMTECSHNGYLVISEMYYPGWHATIDGQEVELERADYLINAIPLPAGKHRVVYAYRPMSFRLGAAGTLLACVAALFVAFVSRRRLNTPPHNSGATDSSPPSVLRG